MIDASGNARRKSEAARLRLEAAVRGVRDERRIQQPAETPNEFQTGYKRFLTLCPDRPSTVGTHQLRRLKNANQQGVYTGSSVSYFPQIHQSSGSRETREQKARLRTARPRLTTSDGKSPTRRPFLTARGRLQAATTTESTNSCAPHTVYDRASIVQSLDCDGMEALQHAFLQMGRMAEEEFTTEMLANLKAASERDEDRVGTAAQLSELFRRIDLHARGEVTWDDFSEFISQTTDVTSALEDTAINKYHGDLTPSPLNFVAEIDALIYLPGADQMVIHDARGKSFQLYDPSTHQLQSAQSSQKPNHRSIVDAVYTPHGRYIITASTSPVLSFHDVENLQLRQQIPTHCYQTALALHSPSTSSTKILYSAGSDGDVHAWDLSSLSHRHAFFGSPKSGQSASMITDLEVLPACALLACASIDGKIYMVDLVTGRVVQTMRGHAKGVSMIRYCAENKYLVSGGFDHKLQVWNPHLDQKVGSLPAHRHPLIGLHVRPDLPEVITADASGVMKIWDLRKFAAVQTIVKELYVKDHSSTARRAMTAMCYIESHEQIAIAHSSIFFLDPVRTKSSSSMIDANPVRSVCGVKQPEVEQDETDKPLHVSFNTPSRSFITITCRQVVSWDAATGSRECLTPIPLHVEVTCVGMMQDGYSCFVGCDDGSVARLMLPSAAVVIHKRVHKRGGEVSSIRLLDHDRLILTCGNDGNIVVSLWETLEPAHILNHWRGLLSVRNFHSDTSPSSASLAQVYSVPLNVRSFFMGNEIERLTAAFAQADLDRIGKIALSSLPRVLEIAFPSSTVSRGSQPVSNPCPADSATLTFGMFMDIVKDSLLKTTADGGGLALSEISAFDVHAMHGTLVTTSSVEAAFCVWNLKNAAVIGDGRIRRVGESSPRQVIGIVKYLHPLPFFLCVEDNSCRLSIWFSRAMPPVTLLPNICILRYAHSHSVGRESLTRASTFLTEPKKVGTKSPDAKPVVIRTVEWFFSEHDDKKLLCVGDEAGHIQLLDLKPVLRRIEEFKKHRSSADASVEGLLPTTLLQKVHRWSTTQSDSVGVRSVYMENVEQLMQPNANKHTVVISVDDLGLVTLWSLDGQLLGRLQDQEMARSQWKLRLDASESSQKTRQSAAAILRHVEQRQSVSVNQQEDNEKRHPLASRLRIQSNNGAPLRSDAEQLRRTTMPSWPRNSTVSAEEKLVAWRQSMTTSGLQSRRSLRVPTPHANAHTSHANEIATTESITRPS